MQIANISLAFAFLAGLASFFSPCVFSLVPAYIGYLSGRSAASARRGQENCLFTFSHGVAFVLGFSFIFIILGGLTATLGIFGDVLFNSKPVLSWVGGVIVIIFGLHLTGIIRIRWLEYDLRPSASPDRKFGYLSSFLMGIFFSAGWSPCVGPILGAILTMALNGGSFLDGAVLLSVYSAGLAIPFLVAATQIGLVIAVIRRFGKLMRYVEIGMGILLIVFGILLIMGRFQQLSTLGSFFGTYDELVIGKYLLILFISLLFLGLIPGWIARRKGYQFFCWWFFGVSLFPIALWMVIRLEPLPGNPGFPGSFPHDVDAIED